MYNQLGETVFNTLQCDRVYNQIGETVCNMLQCDRMYNQIGETGKFDLFQPKFQIQCSNNVAIMSKAIFRDSK